MIRHYAIQPLRTIKEALTAAGWQTEKSVYYQNFCDDNGIGQVLEVWEGEEQKNYVIVKVPYEDMVDCYDYINWFVLGPDHNRLAMIVDRALHKAKTEMQDKWQQWKKGNPC